MDSGRLIEVIIVWTLIGTLINDRLTGCGRLIGVRLKFIHYIFFVHSQIFARVEGSLQDKSTRWWRGMVWTRFVKCTVLLMTSWVACNLHVLNVFACAGLALIPASWNMLQHNWQSQFSKQMFSMKAVILWHREGRGVQHDCWKWYWKTLNTV